MSSYRGNYAVIHRQDPDTYDIWYGILDKTGKEMISIEYDTYILGGGDSLFYNDTELVYYQNNRENLHLLSLSDSGLSTKELGNYSKFFTHTTASGTTYGGVFTAFNYGVMEIQDNTTKELVLINTKGQELLRGYDKLEAKKTSDSTQLTCIIAWDTNGKCAYYVPGGSFSEYCYDSISVSHGYVEAGTTEEDGTTWYQLFTPYGTELFPGIQATSTYVRPDERYSIAWTDAGVYLCHLSSRTCTGPYDDFASLGQNRYLIQYDPFTVINGKGTVIMDEIPGYIGDFRSGYALYTPEGSSDPTCLIDINGEIYDFGQSFRARLLDDAPYGIFCDNTAIMEISGDFYLLRAESDAYETLDPQLLYSSPVSDTLGLPLFDTITLTFDRPVTLPADDKIRLVCRRDDSELAVSAQYGNKSETVIRVKLKDTVLSCDERYSLYIDEDAVWPQSGEEIKAFTGFTEPDDFTFGIGKDGVYLSDLDLMRYFPAHLKNDTAS